MDAMRRYESAACEWTRKTRGRGDSLHDERLEHATAAEENTLEVESTGSEL